MQGQPDSYVFPRGGGEAAPSRDESVAILSALAEYLAEMDIRGSSKVYRDKERDTIERASTLCQWEIVADLTAAALRAYFLRLRKLNRASRTIKLYRDTFDRFGKFCVRRGWLAANPVKEVPPPRIIREPARIIPTEADLLRVIAAGRSDRRSKDWWLAVLTMAESGLRVGETRGLLVEMLRLDMNPPRALLPAGLTKSRRDQTVYFSDTLAGMLRLHTAALPGHEHVFQSPLKRDQMSRYVTRAGVERVRGRCTLSYHSLRHFASERWRRLGLPPEERQLAMRHANFGITADIYSRPQTSLESRFMAIPSLFGAQKTGPIDDKALTRPPRVAESGGVVSPGTIHADERLAPRRTSVDAGDTSLRGDGGPDAHEVVLLGEDTVPPGRQPSTRETVYSVNRPPSQGGNHRTDHDGHGTGAAAPGRSPSNPVQVQCEPCSDAGGDSDRPSHLERDRGRVAGDADPDRLAVAVDLTTAHREYLRLMAGLLGAALVAALVAWMVFAPSAAPSLTGGWGRGLP